MNNVTISIASDFSIYPFGRTDEDGPDNGAAFRKKLIFHLKKGDHVVVNIDGTRGYGSSFLEEVFGGLVRDQRFTMDQFNARIKIENKDPRFDRYKRKSYEYAEQSAAKIANG